MPLLHPSSPIPESPKWRMLFIHPTDSGSVPGTVQGLGMQEAAHTPSSLQSTWSRKGTWWFPCSCRVGKRNGVWELRTIFTPGVRGWRWAAWEDSRRQSSFYWLLAIGPSAQSTKIFESFKCPLPQLLTYTLIFLKVYSGFLSAEHFGI